MGKARAPRRPRRGRASARAEPDQTTPREPGEIAREICLKLLAVRPRTRAELATALRRQGIAEEVATEVLDRYDEVGIVNDAAFARAWVTSRHHSRGLARRALASELRQRGVADETVGEALDELDGDTEAATARELVDRRLRAGGGGGQPDAVVRRLVGMLARKGYPPGLAFRVVKDALADRGGPEAELADQLDADAFADAAADADAAAEAEAAAEASAVADADAPAAAEAAAAAESLAAVDTARRDAGRRRDQPPAGLGAAGRLLRPARLSGARSTPDVHP